MLECSYALVAQRWLTMYALRRISGEGVSLFITPNNVPTFGEVLTDREQQINMTIDILLCQNTIKGDYFFIIGSNKKSESGLVIGM